MLLLIHTDEQLGLFRDAGLLPQIVRQIHLVPAPKGALSVTAVAVAAYSGQMYMQVHSQFLERSGGAEQLHGGHALLEHHQRVLRGVELHLAAVFKSRDLHGCRRDLDALGCGFLQKFHSQYPPY